MKKIFTVLSLFAFVELAAQPVEVNIFQSSSTANTATVGLRMRATGANVTFLGVTFYMLYQSSRAASQSTAQNSVVGVNDSRIVTGYGWGSGSRFTNPAQVQAVPIDPGASGGNLFDRRFVYGNSDDAGGANLITLTSEWDTLLYITLNTTGVTYPQGGYVFQQPTGADPGEALGAALSDENFANVEYSVLSGEVALGGSLPVLFSQFDAKCSGNGTLISWATAQEANSDYFEVQRSTDGTAWKTIGRSPAAGNSGTSRSYNQLDLEAGNALYRIKQVDKDGQAIYTNIERANCEVKNISSVIYPVPAKDVLNVVIKSDRAVRTQLMVFEISGKLVKKLDANVQNGTNNFRIDLKGLISGDYIIKSSDSGIELNKQFSIIR